MIQDAGDVPLAGGRRMRTGLVYRISGALAGPGDLAELRATGIRCVVDLRSQAEDRSAVVDWAASTGVRYENFPIVVGGFANGRYEAILEAVADGTYAEFLLDMYRSLAIDFGEQLAHGLECVARELPAGFGCAAGKDRTGVMNAYLQILLGASEETAVASYLDKAPTVEQLRPQIESMFGYGPDDEIPLGLVHTMSVHREAIERALHEVNAAGGVETFLRAHGLSGAAIETLRAELIEDGSRL
jgi:protein-tyrosine phosphatase